MKTLKKTLALTLAVVMLLCTTMLAGCGVKTISGTYTATYSSDEITSNTFHNGFVTAMGANEVNTIVFNEDGTYTYTKELHTEAEDGSILDPADLTSTAILITYTFTGTYSLDKDNAVLHFPTKCDFNEDWGVLATMGMFLNSTGSYTWENGSGSGDIVQCKEEESHVPMDLFVGPYVLDNQTTSESGFDASKTTVTVTLDKETNTFTYVIVNTDDE